MILLGCSHQGGTAAIVLIVDLRPAIQQQVYDLNDVVHAGFTGIARRPHQRREIVSIAGIDVDTLVQKQAGHGKKSAPGGIHDRRLLRLVDRIEVRALIDEERDDGFASHKGGG